jgi:ornithine cyclodeaminase/alanine dehydrogenase-like protein (mu-crystallin family)
VDSETLRRASAVFADSVENAQIEAGDLIQAVAENALGWQQVQELSALIAGRAIGRQADADITFFKSCGLALEDVAVGSYVYDQAKANGVGRELNV